jgi:hypothetical protein
MRFVVLLAVLGAALAGCTGSRTVTVGGAVAVRPAPAPWCAWYTPMTGAAYGQLVTVTARGPACRSQALIRWIALRSGRPWASTSIHLGTAVAQLERAGTVVQIWQDGSALVTDDTAGYLADDFAAVGWTAQPVICAGGCGPPVTPPVSPGA